MVQDSSPITGSSVISNQDKWRAPTEDGGVLIWPEPRQVMIDARENARRICGADSVLVQNVPLPELRRRLRDWMGHDDAQLAFGTGHQTELHHPGVWAKNVLIDAAARLTEGQAYHFALDSDQPKHLRLRWPGGNEPLTDDPRAASAGWAALLDPPTPAHLAGLELLLQAAAGDWTFQPMLGEFLSIMRRLSLESPNLASALTNALHQLDWSLGLRHHALLMSPLLSSLPYLAFAHHVLARAEQFSFDYNAALDDYRRSERIRTPGRPMPNLRLTGESIEVPFWLDDLSANTRVRATVFRLNDVLVLRLAPDREFTLIQNASAWDAAGTLQQFLRAHNLRLSPRALTLTMVLRLLFADQFAHGIGGARYDRVTDSLIHRHFKLEPPKFCVTTATLFFPDATGRPPACVSCLKQEGHRLRHNVLGDEKMELVQAIADAPRKSPERSRLFYHMHDRLDASTSHPSLREWEQRLRDAKQQQAHERDLFNRELFYPLQPRDRLSHLIEYFRARFISRSEA